MAAALAPSVRQGWLALAALRYESDAGKKVGHACHVAADGRRAARALGQWCRRFEITEPELQVLWCLRDAESGASDQTTLARRLAYSPAQVSSTVERLRLQGWIVQRSVDGDRRRNLWYLSPTAGRVIEQMLRAAPDLQLELPKTIDHVDTDSSRKEAA